MASLTSEIGALLAANGLGTVSTDIFEGNMPDSPANSIGLFDRPGRAPVRAMAKTIVSWQPHLEVRVRNVDYEAGYAKAKAVRAFLQNYNTDPFIEITAQGDIHGLGQNDNEQFVFALTFLCMRRNV